jgi:hypothetical protein
MSALAGDVHSYDACGFSVAISVLLGSELVG